MPSIHITYEKYEDIQRIVNEAFEFYKVRYTRDLYDQWTGGTMSFDFDTKEQAMLFKMAYGGRYRENG